MTLLSRILVGLIGFGSAIHTVATAVQTQGAQGFSHSLGQPAPFNHTCTVGSYLFDPSSSALGLYCNTDDVKNFAYDWTFIDLDLCIGNNDGVLVPSPGGNFSDSCQACNITWSHVYLTPATTTYTATPHTWITTTVTSVSTPRWDDLYLGCGGCWDRGDAMPSATIDLNKVMTNGNGTIGCHSFRGTTKNARPDRTEVAEVAKGA